MPDINPRQWLPLFDAVYEMNSAVGYADFLDSVVIGLRRLIPADFTFIQLLDRRRKKIAYRIAPCNPYTLEEVRYYVEHAHEDPLTAHYDSTDDRQARRISDVISLQAWKKTAHHQNCFARVGVIRSLALPVRVNADTLAGLALDRCGSDFTRRHCDLLDAFAPHFLLAWKRHEAQWLSEEDMEPTMKTVGLSVREHLQPAGPRFAEPADPAPPQSLMPIGGHTCFQCILTAPTRFLCLISLSHTLHGGSVTHSPQPGWRQFFLRVQMRRCSRSIRVRRLGMARLRIG